MTQEIKRCWAYGPQGRCTHPAGHPNDHVIEYTWTDNECVTPSVPTLGQGQPAQAMTGTSSVIDKPEPCVSCGHMHKSDACTCGCYSHI